MTDKIAFQKLRFNFDFTETIDADHPLYQDFSSTRSDYLNRLLYDLSLVKTDTGIEPMVGWEQLKVKHILICGHRGCGKSTELKTLCNTLTKHYEKNKENNQGFLPILVNTEVDLNPNDMEFTDVFILIVESLSKYLKEKKISIDGVFTNEIRRLLAERVLTETTSRELGIEGGAKISAFFSYLRASFKNSTAHTETLRQKIKSNFSDLADQFNLLAQDIEEKTASKLLFIVDGTDKLLDLKQAERMFIDNVALITQLKSCFIFSAPISLPLSHAQANNYYQVHYLPMLKLYENYKAAKKAQPPHEKNYELLRQFVLKRVEKKHFSDEKLIDTLITASGGALRHLIQLLDYAWQEGLALNKIDENCVTTAKQRFINEHFRFFEQRHIDAIRAVYQQDNPPLDENIRFLLFQLAILEYNGDDIWKYPHPIILELSPHFEHS